MIVKAVDPTAGRESSSILLPERWLPCRGIRAPAPAMQRPSRSSSGSSRDTLFGIEAKPLPYLLCQMNLLLHGVESPQIDPLNALRFRMSEIGDRDRVDVIMTNPPFGGEEEKGIQRQLSRGPADVRDGASLPPAHHAKAPPARARDGAGGRAGVVVPNGTLSGDGVAARIKQDLLENFNLHTVVRLPNGVFSPYTPIPTNVLFFDRSGPTTDIWYYEHPLPEGRKNYTKTSPAVRRVRAPAAVVECPRRN